MLYINVFVRGGNVVVSMSVFGDSRLHANEIGRMSVSSLHNHKRGVIMKKILIAAAATLLLSTAANADTVNITIQADFITPSNPGSSTISYAFRPSGPISFRVAGKTCTWVSSASPYGSGGGAGCNYSITVNSSGQFTNAQSNGMGCTASGQPMISACRLP